MTATPTTAPPAAAPAPAVPAPLRRHLEVLAWIDCADELPDDGILVLADGPDMDEVCQAYVEAGVWVTADGFPFQPDEVSHWADMPAGVRARVEGRRRVYISGPMTGLPNLNFPAFHAAAAALAAPDVEVVNPATLNPNPATPWHECMRRDIAELCTCDEVVPLPGWQDSKGATLELHVAERLGLTVREPQAGAEG